MSGALRTALIGFGKMGHGYAKDPVMARHYRYAAHAQVLADHPAFEWVAVVDPDDAALEIARDEWSVAGARTAAEIPDALGIEVAILATPPQSRLAILDALPALRAVIVEKPLGIGIEAARAFLEFCATRGITVSVNLWRRADPLYRELAAGRLRELVGECRSVTVLYGNGLVNNGTHMVDFARMLFGEIADFRLLGTRRGFEEGPIPGDTNPAFALEIDTGLTIAFCPARFNEYRENGVVVWGSEGRLDILNEGLTTLHYPRTENRAMQGEREIASDLPTPLAPTVGHALYALYDNLAAAIEGTEAVCSPADSALESTAWVDRIREADLARPL